MLRLRALRGGAAAEDDEGPLTRMRLQVASGRTGDPSIVEVSAADAKAMALEEGAHVTLRGRKQRRTTCVTLVSDDLSEGEVRLSATSLNAVRLAEGDDVIVAIEPDLREAERVLLLPFASSLADADMDSETAFDKGLAPYLKDQDRPLTVGDIIETPLEGADGAVVRWKVLEIEPEAANPIEAAR